jgi:UDP-N-acetyl-D-glucosamine dehydrogenase
VKIAIIGQGYVGYALSVALTNVGMSVIGFDLDRKVIEQIKTTKELMHNYKPTVNEIDVKDLDTYIIAVPTPLDEAGIPDLSYLIQAAQLIARSASKGALVINESTSYPGTLREIVVTEISKTNNAKFLFASAPERIDPANSNWQLTNTPRVIAGIDNESSDAAYDLYRLICTQIKIVSSPEVAEASKLFENTFRQVNISLVNELAQITEKLGISATEVLDAAATKPFGFMRFNPSIGVGGHCIPIDPIYLAHKAEELGATASLIRQADLINHQMPYYVLQRVKILLGGDLIGRTICIIGISYKPNVNDLRESPSIVLWHELEKNGAQVFFHDDIVLEFKGSKSSKLESNKFDLTIIAVVHSNLDVSKAIKSAPLIFDCTGTISNAIQF